MKRTLSVLFACISCLVPGLPGMAEDGPVVTPPPSSNSALTLLAGQSRLLRFPAITRAAIGNPAVADIAILSGTEILLNAKGPGETLLYVRTKKGAASVTVKVVAPTPEAVDLSGNINRALADTGVTASVSGGAVVLRGTVDTPEDETRAVAVAKAFSPNVASIISVSRDATTAMARTLTTVLKPMGVTARASGMSVVVLEGATTPENAAEIVKIATQIAGGFQIVNMVRDSVAGRQVVVHARIVAADQTAMRNLGFDWGNLLSDDKGNVTGVGTQVIFGESRSPGMNANRGGPINRLQTIGAALQALEESNRAKTLSAPDVLVQDNHKAEIVVGGEIPVPVPQIGGGANTIVIQYKEYGVRLTVTPRILDDGSVSMHVVPEVSTLDQANAVYLAGFRIPAFKLRRAESDVTVKSGSTLVIGGLLQDEDIDIMRKVPLLADLPILGELFKFRSKSRLRTQLVILVTPEVLEPGVAPAIPPLAELKADRVSLPSPLKMEKDPPEMPGLPAPGKSPIPMRQSRRLTTNPGLGLM